MKKCTSCAKDLPDAAMHCVFCGTKQPGPAPGAAANAKTVMGWQASDVLKDLQAQGKVPPGVGVGAPPPAAPPPAAPVSGLASTLAAPPPAGAPVSGLASTLVSPAGPPQAAPGRPAADAATMYAAPAPQLPPQNLVPPPQNLGPSAADAATSYGAPAPQLPPQNLAPPPRPASDAATMFAAPAPQLPQPSSPYAPLKTLPAPSAYDNPPAGGFGGPNPGFGGPNPGFGGPGPLPGAGMPPGASGGFGGPGPLPGAGMPPGASGGFGGMPPGGGMPGGGMPGPGMPGPGMPPGGGYGAPGGFQPPPAGGFQPGGFQPPPAGGFQPPPAGGFQPPPAGGFQPAPMPMPMAPAPMAPPYLASRTAARAGAPREPYAEGLRLVLIIFGVLLLLAFIAPMSTAGKMVFRWDLLKAPGVGAIAKFDQVYLAAAGILALVFGLVPLATVPRGALAAVLGLTPLALHFVVDDIKDAPSFRWQDLVTFVSLCTLVPGLLLRQEYRSQLLPRILVTVGALGILIPLLVPEKGGDPEIKQIIDAISKSPGKLKVLAILKLWPVIIAFLSLMCWLPAPSSGAAKVLAWLFILTIVVFGYTAMILAGHIGTALKANLNELLLGGWVFAAWLAFIGYGAATVIGKNLEHA